MLAPAPGEGREERPSPPSRGWAKPDSAPWPSQRKKGWKSPFNPVTELEKRPGSQGFGDTTSPPGLFGEGVTPPRDKTLQRHHLRGSALAPIKPVPRPAAVIRSWQAPRCFFPRKKHLLENAGLLSRNRLLSPQKPPCWDGRRTWPPKAPPPHCTARHVHLLSKPLTPCQIFVQVGTVFKGKSQNQKAHPGSGVFLGSGREF